MSALKLGGAKRPRMDGQPGVGSSPLITGEENVPPMSATPALMPNGMKAGMNAQKKPPHPKWHKQATLASVWATMDSQSFLHLTDTLALSDVVVQPKSIASSTGSYTNVTFIQAVKARNWKLRVATCKMPIVDVIKMLYLCDCMYSKIQKTPAPTYEAWVKSKVSAFGAKYGMVEDANHCMLCQYILAEDPTFSFYADCIGDCGVFYRKICHHSYKNGKGETKIRNPAMVKCKGSRGMIEYLIEAMILPLPDGYFKKIEEAEERAGPETVEEEEVVPETQPMDGFY